MTDVSLAAAFIAGLVSFLSPCVLPLVPGYISMLSGIGMEQLRQGQQPRGGPKAGTDLQNVIAERHPVQTPGDQVALDATRPPVRGAEQIVGQVHCYITVSN